ncbi:MAG: ABC transporter substrate-binding protein, partial [Janthinobacterium lividum]
MKEYIAFEKNYYPAGRPDDQAEAFGYGMAALLVQILKQAGDDLTRENIMRQATNLKDVRIPLELDGITGSTMPTDYHLLRQMQFK